LDKKVIVRSMVRMLNFVNLSSWLKLFQSFSKIFSFISGGWVKTIPMLKVLWDPKLMSRRKKVVWVLDERSRLLRNF